MHPFKKASIGFLSSLAFFFVCEALLRLYSTVSDNDFRVPPLPEHPTIQVLCSDEDTQRLCPDRGSSYERVRPEVFVESPKGKRMIVIGESFVYGLGIEDNQAWPKQLQQQTGIETLNFGRCGTYASQLIPILKAALTLKPDLVILSVGNNEHTMTSFFTGWLGRDSLRSYRVLRFLGNIQLYGLLSHALSRPRYRAEENFEYTPDLQNPIDKKVYSARRRPPDLSAFPDGLASHEVRAALEKEQRLKELIFEDQLQAMASMTQAADIPILLTTLPQEIFTPPTLSGTRLTDKTKVLEQMQSASITRAEDGIRLDPTVAIFHYEKALKLRAQGKHSEAIQAYEKAISLDLVPDSTPEINDIIREVARRNRIPLLDFRKKTWETTRHRGQFFRDPVHVNPAGAYQMAAWTKEFITRNFPQLVQE